APQEPTHAVEPMESTEVAREGVADARAQILAGKRERVEHVGGLILRGRFAGFVVGMDHIGRPVELGAPSSARRHYVKKPFPVPWQEATELGERIGPIHKSPDRQ